MKRLARIICDLLVIGLAASFIYMFISIKVNGYILAFETNQVVLWGEIVLGFVLLVVGINNFLDDA